MNVSKAIHERRSVKSFTQERHPDPNLIEKIIEAATWAPSHHMNQAWRFDVFEGNGLLKLAELDAQIHLNELPDDLEEGSKTEIYDRRIAKMMQYPIVILVSVPKLSNRKSIYVEELAAGAAAIQNLLLAAHEEGLATFWATGKLARDKATKSFLEIPEEEEIIGVIRVGYPKPGEVPEQWREEREPLTNKLNWHQS
ncbi:MAG: nitroreductase [Dehalococcoidia bacterium]|nr:nitroreductase [Dehalococcoidia bacterium]